METKNVKLYINLIGGLVQEVCGPKDFEGKIYLVDFSNNDSKMLSDAYSLILEDDNIISLPLIDLIDEDDLSLVMSCSICEKKEKIDPSDTEWMPSVFLDEDDELGPICPQCIQKFVHFDRGPDAFVLSDRITLVQLPEVQGLVKHLALRQKQESDT